jgi:hypothetical protein
VIRGSAKRLSLNPSAAKTTFSPLRGSVSFAGLM